MIVYGPWIWRDTGAGFAWTAPDEAISGIDLRSFDQCAQPGGEPQGVGMFEVPDAPPAPGFTVLTDAPCDLIPTAAVAAFTARLGLASYPVRPQLLIDLLWEILTEHADPTSRTLTGPLMPTAAGDLILTFGALTRRRRLSIGDREWPLVQLGFQDSYRRLVADAAAGFIPADLPRQVLATFLATMRTDDASLFIPPDLPRVTPLTPSTTITDNFAARTADSSPMSASSEGWSWNNLSGTWAIVGAPSNCVSRCSSVEAFTRAEFNLTGTNNTSQTIVKHGASAQFSGVAARFSASDSSGTAYLGFANSSTNDCRISKLIAGARTDLVPTGSGGTLVLGSTLLVQADGSNLLLSISGTPAKTVTDSTSWSSGTRTGMWAYGAEDRTFFQGADVVSGGISGTLSRTLDLLTTAPATGTVAVSGALSSTPLAALTTAPATGTVAVAASLAVVPLDLLTLTGTGTVGALPITGTLTTQLAPLTLSLGQGTVAITAALPPTTLDALLLTGAGVVDLAPVIGTLTAQLAPLVVSTGQGTVAVHAALAAVPLAPLTLTAQGFVSTGAPITGHLSTLLAPLLVFAAGRVAPLPVACPVTTLGDLQTLMIQRWDGVVFWTPEEARLALNEALREWNLLTGTWRIPVQLRVIVGDPEVPLPRAMTYGMRVATTYDPAAPAGSSIRRPLIPSSLAELDLGRPSWRLETTLSGGDVPPYPTLWAPVSLTRIAIWPTLPITASVLFADGVMATPTLVNPSQDVNLNEEIIDVVVDMALHIVAFKEGGARWRATRPYFEAFLRAAADENAVLKTNQRYRRFAGLDRRRNLQPSTGATNQLTGLASQFSRHDQSQQGGGG